MNDVLRDMLNRFVFVYTDDILIFFKTVEEHIHIYVVLLQLCEHSLFVKAERCDFHSSLLSFLRYMISPGNIWMDPAKVSTILNWPVPYSRKQLQWFLGFANFYRRFIRSYSSVVAPVTALTSIKKPFSWSLEADTAFRMLKERFTSIPILWIPDPALQFVVEVDKSDIGVGTVTESRLRRFIPELLCLLSPRV